MLPGLLHAELLLLWVLLLLLLPVRAMLVDPPTG
jgi:hypothetical protein